MDETPLSDAVMRGGDFMRDTVEWPVAFRMLQIVIEQQRPTVLSISLGAASGLDVGTDPHFKGSLRYEGTRDRDTWHFFSLRDANDGEAALFTIDEADIANIAVSQFDYGAFWAITFELTSGQMSLGDETRV